MVLSVLPRNLLDPITQFVRCNFYIFTLSQSTTLLNSLLQHNQDPFSFSNSISLISFFAFTNNLVEDYKVLIRLLFRVYSNPLDFHTGFSKFIQCLLFMQFLNSCTLGFCYGSTHFQIPKWMLIIYCSIIHYPRTWWFKTN